MVAYAVGLVVVVGAVLLWLAVLRDVKAPAGTTDGPAAGTRPSATECAELIAGLTQPSAADQRLPADVRARLRQCFDGALRSR
jgi:hypothetical protein